MPRRPGTHNGMTALARGGAALPSVAERGTDIELRHCPQFWVLETRRPLRYSSEPFFLSALDDGDRTALFRLDTSYRHLFRFFGVRRFASRLLLSFFLMVAVHSLFLLY